MEKYQEEWRRRYAKFSDVLTGFAAVQGVAFMFLLFGESNLSAKIGNEPHYINAIIGVFLLGTLYSGAIIILACRELNLSSKLYGQRALYFRELRVSVAMKIFIIFSIVIMQIIVINFGSGEYYESVDLFSVCFSDLFGVGEAL